VLGLFTLNSAAGQMAARKVLMRSQIVSLSLGLTFMFVILFLDYAVLSRFAYPIYCIGVILLVLVLFKGQTAQGSQRWLNLGFVKFQVSDLMKLALVIALAKWYSTSKIMEAYSLTDLLPPFALLGMPFLLILKQPDLGTGLLLAFVTLTIVLFAKIETKSLLILLVLGVIVVTLAWFFILKDYQKNRVHAFLDPMSSPKGAGYNVIQSMIAVGSGKFWGKGYKKGTQTSLHFLPEHHTDFIFSAWAEERGFLGSIVLLFIYTFVFFRIIMIAATAKDKFGLILSIGGGAIFFWYFFINVNMVIGMMPVVGIPLPFLSYGGTAMVVNFLILGVILNVRVRRSAY
jgi:rod shape determining protein RodA